MPTYFQKPENALRRAQEFLDVDKKESALEILSEVMKSRKHRQWNKVHEDIMMLFVDLCVELKRNQLFKEVIHQYKNITLQVNPNSLIEVVRKYLSMAEKRTQEARESSKAAVTDDVDDLDMIETPESLMMSAVSGESAQDRSDRTILVPWLKFMWESYRQSLDLLRNNNKMERLYHDVAQMAFKFCEKYGRKTEFRKLNDTLRSHLSKFQQQLASGIPVPATGVNLSNPETQAMHLETRLYQLEHSMTLELYNEAYKSIEDIWSLVALSKKPPKPAVMSNYFTKVALVFWKCNSYVFHAAALHKLFNLHREHKKNMAHEEIQNMATKVLCATLAIPLPYVRDRNADSLLESGEISSISKQKLLCNLLGMTIPPTRQSLCAELARSGIVQLAHPEISAMFHNLEKQFQPLKLATTTAQGLAAVANSHPQYLPALEDIVVCRTLIQVSQVYQSVKIERFIALLPFANRLRLECTIVEAARNLEIPVRIDHKKSSLFFGGFSQLGISQREEGALVEGPSVKTADQLSRQLVFLGQALQGVMDIIKTDEASKVSLKKEMAQKYMQTAQRDHQKLLRRKDMIEERKEHLEKLMEQRELEEQRRLRLEQDKILLKEEQRLKDESEKRERERKELEKKNIQYKVKMERLEMLKSTDAGRKAFAKYNQDELDTLSADDILAKHLEKEKRELTERIKTQEKKLDHFTRAKRLVEIPLLKEDYSRVSENLKKQHEIAEEERINKLKEQHERMLAFKSKAQAILPYRDEFEKKLVAARKKEFEQKMLDWEKRLEDEKARRLEERRQERIKNRRDDYIQNVLAERQREKEEAEAKQRAEEERKIAEEQSRRQAEYAEKKAKLDEQARLQREREAAIEAKMRAPAGTAESDGGKVAWRPSNTGKWRDKEREKEESFKKHEETFRRHEEQPAREEGSWRQRKPVDDRRRDDRPRDKDHRDKDRDFRDRDRERSDRDRDHRERSDRDRDYRDKDRERSDRDRDYRDKDRERSDRDRGEKDRERSDQDRGEKDRERSDRDRGEKDRERSDRDRGEKDRERSDRDRDHHRDKDRERSDRDYRDKDRDRDRRDRDHRDYRDKDRDHRDRDYRDRDRERSDRDYRDKDRDRRDYRSDKDRSDRGGYREERPRPSATGGSENSWRMGAPKETGGGGTPWRRSGAPGGSSSTGFSSSADGGGGGSSWRTRSDNKKSTPAAAVPASGSPADDGWTRVDKKKK